MIVYRPDAHRCTRPSRTEGWRNPRGTIFRCDECGSYWVSDGNGHWNPPWPFGRAARRIKQMQADQ